MHIGVVLGAINPNLGGGYTLQSHIIAALREVSGESEHTFSIFYDRKHGQVTGRRLDTSERHRNGKQEWVPIDTPSVMKRGISALKRNSALARLIIRRRSALENKAIARKVEILWFVRGGTYEAVDMPYIATVWDLQHRLQPWFPEVSSQGRWDFREATHEWFLQRATFVITGTEEGRRQIETLYQVPSEHIRIIPLPVPDFALRPATSKEKDILKKFGLSGGYLLYPAQFWAHKNHANLLLALKLLRDHHGVLLTLVLVGSDKGNLSYIRSLVEQQNLVEQVRFLGFVGQEELVALYRSAFAVPFVTYFGPDNLPPLEAFALRCPVVASDIPGAREQLGNAALFVNPSSPTEIANALAKLCTEPIARNALIEAGCKRATLWTGRDYVKKMFAVFDEFEPVRRCWSR